MLKRVFLTTVLTFISLLIFYTNTTFAACGSQCGWNGSSPTSACVPYDPGTSRCNFAGGSLGCVCLVAQGCTSSGPFPAACTQTGPTISNNNQALSCCGMSPTTPPSTPAPSGGGGGSSCSGSCLTPGAGDNNCGDINGSQSASGSCPSGQLCCAFGGGGGPTSGCTITTNGPFVVAEGQRIAVSVNASGTGGGTFGQATFQPVGPGSGVFTVPGGWSPVPGPTRPYVSRIDGVTAGSRFLRVHIENGTGCTKDIPVTITGTSTPPPAPAPTVSITANGAANVTIPSGTAATLAWTSTNATTCSASGDWNGTKAVPSGSQSTGNVTTTNSYTITCTGPGGTATDTAQVNVSVTPTPPPSAPTVNITANGSNGPISITSGTAATLAWTATNSTGCSASGGWSGSKAVPSGSQSSGNLSSNTTFSITCTGAGGSATDSVTVNVAGLPPAPTVSLTANGSGGPVSVTSGSAVTLAWTTTNATTCTASASVATTGWSGGKAVPSGSQSSGALTSSRTFTLSCSGSGGSASDSVTVNITTTPTAPPTPTPPPPTAPTVSLTANGSGGPVTITSGSAVTLAWTSTNSTSCSASGGWTGGKTIPGGSQSSGSLSTATTFTISCAGPGGSASDSVQVNISAPPPPAAPTVSLTANGSGGPVSITTGTAVTLAWTSTNSTSCNASGGWSGSKAVPSGSQSSGNLATNTTFTITCTGAGGSATDSVTVNMTGLPPAPVVNLTANGSSGPVTVSSGAAVTLAWTTTNATTCTASASVATTGWSGGKTVPSGNQSSGALTSSRTFTLSCAGTGGSSSDSVTVNISAPPASAPTIDITANGSNGPITVTSGTSVTLAWTTTNSTSCSGAGSWSGAKTIPSGSQASGAITTSRTYTINCAGAGGSASDSVTVNVTAAPPPPAAPTVSLTANGSGGPITVTSGTSATLAWATTNATTCTASNAWSGNKAVPSGSQSSGAINSNGTYLLTCVGPGGSGSDSVQINVAGVPPPPPPPPAPTVNLAVNGLRGVVTVPSGTNATIAWITTNATTCTASNAWSGNKAVPNGNQSSGAINSNRTYLLTCVGPGGSRSDSVTVNVGAAPPVLPVVDLLINGSNGPITAAPGAIATLDWTSTGATSCTASSSIPDALWTGAKAISGSQSSSAIAASTTYTLSCTGIGGSDVDSVNVNVGVGQCAMGRPKDPTNPVCIPDPTGTGSITWTWDAVPNATEYSFEIIDSTGTVVPGTDTGWQNGQTTFNCRPNQATPDLCSRTTFGLYAGKYRSRVAARGLCTASLQVPSDEYELLTCPAVAWWQATNGHVVSQGNIVSKLPIASENVVSNGLGGYPGIVIRNGLLDTGAGTLSTTLWSAQNILQANKPDYSSFDALIPVSINPPDPGPNIDQNALNSGGASTGDGYNWYKRPASGGGLTIAGDINLAAGRKVIIFVDGPVNITGKITFNTVSSFLIIIARGDITVDPLVTTTGTTPTLTGIFYTNGRFSSGAGTAKLNVLGSVVANGGVVLERDLGFSQNAVEPAENFTLSPELLLNYPSTLTFKHPAWSEVAP